MSLKEDIDELKKYVIEAKTKSVTEKKFRLPFGKKVGKGQRKRNFITVLLINENSSYEFKKYQIEDQTVTHNLIPRLATSGHVLFDKKGNPLLILPNWGVEPFSPLQHFKDSLDNGSNIKGYAILMAKMLQEQVGSKPKIGNLMKWILGLGFVGIIAYAFISGGGA